MGELESAWTLHERLQMEALENVGFTTEALVPHLAVPRDVVTRFETAAADIAKDATLSELGREQRRDEARAKATADVEAWVSEHVPALDAQIAEMRESLAAKLTDGGPRPSDLELRLLAERLSTFDAVERMSLYASADDRTRAAMELASELAPAIPTRRPEGGLAWERLVDEEAIARHREQRLATADPETTQAMRRLERQRGLYTGMAATAKALLRDARR